jgi:hypothetical protein
MSDEQQMLFAPRGFFVEVDSLLSWVAHRGWVIRDPEDRQIAERLQRQARAIYEAVRSEATAATPPPALAPDARIKEAIVRLMARCGPLDSWKKNEHPELSNVIVALSNLLDGPFTTQEAIEVGKRIGVSLESAHPQAAPDASTKHV